MDLTTTKIVVLAVVGLIILVTLLGEFRPRSRRNRRPAPGPVRSDDDRSDNDPGAERIGAGTRR